LLLGGDAHGAGLAEPAPAARYSDPVPPP
jgi:hypothetical protein